MRLIAFTGKSGSGKDTAAMYLVKKHFFLRYGFADPIKAALNTLFGWRAGDWLRPGWKEEEDAYLKFSPRKAAQTLGTEWGRQMLRKDIWLCLADMMYSSLDTVGEVRGMVISDLRYDNEASWVKRMGGEVYQLIRPSATEVRKHTSEEGVHPSYIDDTLWNNGSVEDLYKAVERRL